MSSRYSCDNLVISCIDFRIQPVISAWLHDTFPHATYDYASFAGSVKELSFAEKQIEISESLHKIKQLILIEHEDCGAYGHVENARELQMSDLRKAKKRLQSLYPQLEIRPFYLHVSGVFEEIQ